MNGEPERQRRAALALPNGFTLASLFFGIFAIVTAARGTPEDYNRAAWYIVIAAVADALDGRVARATRTASRFGEELDSLVDAISFGLAPALIMYFAVLRHDGWDWVLVFLFCSCAVLRLARFNVVQAGRPKKHFIGLPSPAAGGTLASYYWFSQTDLYSETFLATWPWHFMLRFLMLGLGVLMISNVPYPAWPTFSVRTLRGVVGLVAFIGMILCLIFVPQEFMFPLGVIYVLYGVARVAVLGLVERGDDDDDDNSSEDSESPGIAPLRTARHSHGRPHRASHSNRPGKSDE
jgi:CDP-diacylglycerol--serine O-phosphatidyltransferase